MITLADKLKA